MRFQSFHSVKTFLQHFQPESQNLIGVWIAPRFCSIGEFWVPKTGDAKVKWAERISFTDYPELHTALQKVVKKRWLTGVPVTVSLSTPDVFAVPIDIKASESIENQDILPPGISWDSVEYAVRKGSEPVFACIRQTDIDFWANFFKETGLVTGCIVPSGMGWSQFIVGNGDISFTLPAGTLVSRNDGKWKGTFFVPETQKDRKSELSFSSPVRPEYKWCPSFLLPVFEGVLSFRQDPSFNLNPYSFSADKLNSIERNFRQFCFKGAIGLAGLLLALILINGILYIWTSKATQSGASSASVKALTTKQENARVKDRLASIRSLASSKSSINRILHDVGSIITDSIWYSEMSLSAENGVNIVILGHSLSESAITKVLAGAEGIVGVKSARREYTEKVSSDQVSRLTGGRRSEVLYRYKLILAL